MMKRSGAADLPLHSGRVPSRLYERMSRMARAITESVVEEYGSEEFLSRISDPHWFQAFGSVLGMDWHSSGITASVTDALKQAINPISRELGLYVCGGRGAYSRRIPFELMEYTGRTGLDGESLVRCSRLTAKIDNTAIQDGFQIYHHAFILSDKGSWAVIQQGMNGPAGMARRYHWRSAGLKSFVEEPHTSVVGENLGEILNLTDRNAGSAREGILKISRESPGKMIDEIRLMVLPTHHDISYRDVDLKRLGAVLAIAYDRKFTDFEDLLLLEGLGPKTLRSLTLVSEVIHGTPSRFRDPARFAIVQGGMDGHPFPVQSEVYDETCRYLKKAIDRARLGHKDKQKAIMGLATDKSQFTKLIIREKKESLRFGGMTASAAFKKISASPEPAASRTKKKNRPAGLQLSLSF